MHQFYAAIAIFILTYIGVASEKINKTLIVLIGATLMTLIKVIPSSVAFHAIDLNVIFLLVGMMIIVHILAHSGCFQWLAIKMFHISKGDPVAIMVMLSVATAVTSAFLDNVTTVLLIAPVTIVLVQYLELDPVPFLIAEILASNIGGAATLIGDPPNILIGSAANIPFNDFLIHLGPVIVVILIFFLITMRVVFKRSFHVTQDVKARIHELDAREAIKDTGLLKKGLFVLALVIAGFVLHEVVHFEVATVALAGATLLLAITRYDVEEAFNSVEWTTIFFFVGLFILVDGLVQVGAIEMLAQSMITLTKGSLFGTVFLVMWFSAFASAIVDNIPYVATMIPIVKTVGPVIAEQSHLPLKAVMVPLWWSLSLGACLGGNGSLIGASANLIVAGIANKSGHKISFVRFLKYGFPLMIQALIICTGYVYVRYLM